jgi:hypothetical protein
MPGDSPGFVDRHWELGYQGSSNPLVRYITQGRMGADRPYL